jgi:hypothetical protein
MYRRVVVAILLLAGCDAGVAPTPTPAPIRTAPTPPPPPAPPTPPPPPTAVDDRIDWELGGLGTWRGNVIGGVFCHVQIDFATHRATITDPDGTTSQALTAGSERELRELAKAVHTEPVVQPSDSCTDRSEILHVGELTLRGSCPITSPAAASLIERLSAFCKAPP